ncbi:uncharacterized protein PV09_03162 [Verruconis gallopava]|uniref:Histidinol-phosphatase n=1 Tax=Verruconis gallopava TaxID=253628 RepID=A0A0D2AG99_9PEZI|nr:uncharacterized protein PV09_03162 [Verruconis gallopava]KIW05978.1 hypothetical protein PV09_03162 [Verruconis gallopava]
MPFSHHSHCGQFCLHAKDSLEEVIQTAIAKGMKTFALTEHMPRDLEDLYPEEIEHYRDAQALAAVFDNYYQEAQRLRLKYGDQIHLPIGFESEWIRPSSLDLIKNLQTKFKFDLFVGSVHHVHTIPIDFDRPMYEQARRKAGGSDEQLFKDYFDAQEEMLHALRPPVVGHFDLIRLLSDDPNGSFRPMPEVWERILRNLDFIASYGGLLEINSAAVRKGMREPYPQIEICQEFVSRGGGFVLSDDSHGVEQVATNYARVLPSIEAAGITRLFALQKVGTTQCDALKADFEFVPIDMEEVKRMSFWTS